MVLSSAQDVIATIERHSASAWPAPIVQSLCGWEMRFAPNSSSKRINSLNPVAPDVGQFRTVLKAYIAECEKRNCAAHVRLLPLARENEREVLSSLGVDGVGATSVEWIENLSSAGVGEDVFISAHVTDAWLDAYTGAHAYPPEERAAVKAILDMVPHNMGFAHIVDQGVPVASGRIAVIDGLAGFYQIATAPDARRKGHARRIMAALSAFAAEQGARQGYLQVEMRNATARALYGSLGFKSLYIYDYWPVPASIRL